VKLKVEIAEFLWKLFVTLLIVSSLSFCVYNYRVEGEKHRLNSEVTPENIARWDIRKKKMVETMLCQIIDEEVTQFKRAGSFCSESFDKLVDKARYMTILMGDTWFDAVDIPKGYRSVEYIHIDIENFQCGDESLIRSWKSCPIGYESTKK
jgi:hypothetical protein